MTYGFKMANSVTDLRVTGDAYFFIYVLYVQTFLPIPLTVSGIAFLGMLKDVEDDLQRRVKVCLTSI